MSIRISALHILYTPKPHRLRILFLFYRLRKSLRAVRSSSDLLSLVSFSNLNPLSQICYSTWLFIQFVEDGLLQSDRTSYKIFLLILIVEYNQFNLHEK